MLRTAFLAILLSASLTHRIHKTESQGYLPKSAKWIRSGPGNEEVLLEYSWRKAAANDPDGKEKFRKVLDRLRASKTKSSHQAAEKAWALSAAYRLDPKEADLDLIKTLTPEISAPVDAVELMQVYEVTGEVELLEKAKSALPKLEGWEQGSLALSLYRATAERKWLDQAMNLAEKPIDKKKKSLSWTHAIRRIRFLNLLYHYTGKENFKEASLAAFKEAKGSVRLDNPDAVGLLLAAEELDAEPIHIVVVSPKGSAEAKALFRAALLFPAMYARVEWWDKAEGPLLRKDVDYPELSKPAAFACSGTTCSLPVFDPKELPTTVRRIFKITVP